MITQQEEFKNDEAYAKVCLEQIDILSGINKAISQGFANIGMTDKRTRIIQDNVALIMQLRREYNQAI